MEAPVELEENETISHYNWIATLIGTVLFLSFLWLNRNLVRPDPSTGDLRHNSICGSPGCARCGNLVGVRLKCRFEAFFDRVPDTESSFAMRNKIHSLITESVTEKTGILSAVYAESGYKCDVEESGANLETLPHIWMFPGLARCTFWDPGLYHPLHEIVSLFERPENLRGIQEDFRFINESSEGWKINTTPSGKWRVYQLYDQGEEIVGNSIHCPFTCQLLMSVPLFMKQHVFGGAMFSVLAPGSSIEPHTGPCNYRLRCHLPLVTPPGYKIRVGRDISVWKTGQVLVFDDSFVHEVWHEEMKLTEEEFTSNAGRVVLIFDIWHPGLMADEKAAIKYIFQ
jgi:aspartate beta-hydroxylase